MKSFNEIYKLSRFLFWGLALFFLSLVIFQSLSLYKEKKNNIALFNKSLAFVLFDSVESKDIKTIRRVLRGFGQSNPNIIFCVKIDNYILTKDSEMCNARFEKFKVPLTKKYINIASRDISLEEKLVRLTLLYIVVALLLVYLTRVLFSFINLTRNDISTLVDGGRFNFKEFEELFSNLAKAKELERKSSEVNIKLSISKQVAHDIRSPLAALNMITKEIDSLPEVTRLMLRNSVHRIQDIANNLLQEKRRNIGDAPENISSYLLMPLIEEVVSEKRTALRPKRNIVIESNTDSGYGVFVKVCQSHFKRIISNLINNSVEAFENESGLITISQKKRGQNVELMVSDNGKGIPQNIICKLGQKGASFGKEKNSESGSGLGLFHARESLERWGGSFRVESLENEGTDIILTLPLQKEPSWFVPELKIKQKQKIVIIDDDSTIHQIWEQRLNKLADLNNLELIHFTNPHDFENWSKTNNESEVTYLCDYEFIGHKINGLDLINELSISKKAILVTSRYEEENVHSRCNELGVKLIPKMMAEIVPISIISNARSIDIVHIDDDELIRLSWNIKAQQAGKTILSFEGPEKLYSSLDFISRETVFYIDSSLGENVIKGQDLAKKLFDLGYQNLYLSTGYEKDNFSNMPWIKDVIGKEAPL